MKYTKQDCIDGLQRAAEELGEAVSLKEYKDGDYSPSASTIAVRFGSWNDAKEAAGLGTVEAIQRGDALGPDRKAQTEPTYSKQDCIDELQRAAEECGRPLGVEEWRSGGYSPSDRTLTNKFGSWNEAKKAAGLEVITRGANEMRVGSKYGMDSRGYERWKVSNRGTEHRVLVHRLIAIAEYGPEAVAGNVVHHKNGCKFDNRPSNLEVLSAVEHSKLHWDQGDMYADRRGPSA